MMMNIRKATVSDIPQIMALIKEVVPLMIAAGNFQWDNTYPNAEVFQKDIEKSQLWVVELGDVIVGVSAITTDQDPEYAHVGWDINEESIVTHRLAVRLGYQGMGIAQSLLTKAEEIAAERGIKSLRIDTNSMNTATQSLFPKAGYVFSGEVDLDFRPNLRFYCYEKRLDK